VPVFHHAARPPHAVRKVAMWRGRQLRTKGKQTITAIDTVFSSIKGVLSITVN
jgi:hypothetical protein